MFDNIRMCCHCALVIVALVLGTAMTAPASAQVTNVLHVDRLDGLTTPNGPDPGEGDWDNAYLYLQNALARAQTILGSEPSAMIQIWVRGGSSVPPYKPDEDNANHPNGSDSQSDTFMLHEHVAIYGGFAGPSYPGGGETDKNQRNHLANVTILDGDIDGDNTLADNSYHVVTGFEVKDTAILDGFTIRNGNAVGAPQPSQTGAECVNGGGGGGMLLFATGIDNAHQD